MLKSTSNILYVRAALQPLSRPIRKAGGIVQFLQEHLVFDDLFVPYFYGARPFWRVRAKTGCPPSTNSGALGKRVASLPGTVISNHPTHSFVGFGARVEPVLRAHTSDESCFYPISALADQYDFSMLILGCLEASPGFSTVHVAQHRLGLSQRHLLRYLFRWDEMRGDQLVSFTAPEAPGCSLSFDKFYFYYEKDANLIRGEWFGVSWLFVPSARRALQTELELLRERGRFVDCRRMTCMSCRLRWY